MQESLSNVPAACRFGVQYPLAADNNVNSETGLCSLSHLGSIIVHSCSVLYSVVHSGLRRIVVLLYWRLSTCFSCPNRRLTLCQLASRAVRISIDPLSLISAALFIRCSASYGERSYLRIRRDDLLCES